MMTRFNKLFALLLTPVYFATNVALAHMPETNVWSERAVRSSSLSSSRHAVSRDPRLSKGQSGSWIKTFQDDYKDLVQFGSIRKTLTPAVPNGITVLHIQDVHQNLEAQKNIGHAIRKLAKDNRADLIALEGAFGPVDLSAFQNFPGRDIVRAAADTFLEKNKISGPVHAALTSSPSPRVVGVDDESHYRANVAAYRESAPLIESAKQEATRAALQLDARKQAVYSPVLLVFDRAVTSYRSGKSKMKEYAETLSLHTAARPNVKIFLDAAAIESKMKTADVESERAQLIQALLDKLDGARVGDLKNASVALRAGRLSAPEFYERLIAIAKTARVDLNSFPSLKSYLDYTFMTQRIDAERLFSELRSMEAEAYRRLCASDTERELVRESQRAHLAGKLTGFALTKEEWESYLSLRGASFATRRSLKSFERFYSEAEARDAAMARNLAGEALNAKNVILVTGGFHAAGIDRRLVEAGYNVVTFVPKIATIESEKGSAYLSSFTQEKTPLEKLFQGQKLFLANEAWTGVEAGPLAVQVVGNAANTAHGASARDAFRPVLTNGTAGYVASARVGASAAVLIISKARSAVAWSKDGKDWFSIGTIGAGEFNIADSDTGERRVTARATGASNGLLFTDPLIEWFRFFWWGPLASLVFYLSLSLTGFTGLPGDLAHWSLVVGAFAMIFRHFSLGEPYVESHRNIALDAANAIFKKHNREIIRLSELHSRVRRLYPVISIGPDLGYFAALAVINVAFPHFSVIELLLLGLLAHLTMHLALHIGNNALFYFGWFRLAPAPGSIQHNLTKQAADLHGAGRYLEQLEFVRDALRTYPNEANLWFHFGTGLLETGRLNSRDLRMFRKTLDRFPRDPGLWSCWARICERTGRIDTGIEDLEIFRSKNPQVRDRTDGIYVRLRSQRAMRTASNGDNKGAIADLDSLVSSRNPLPARLARSLKEVPPYVEPEKTDGLLLEVKNEFLQRNVSLYRYDLNQIARLHRNIPIDELNREEWSFKAFFNPMLDSEFLILMHETMRGAVPLNSMSSKADPMIFVHYLSPAMRKKTGLVRIELIIDQNLRVKTAYPTLGRFKLIKSGDILDVTDMRVNSNDLFVWNANSDLPISVRSSLFSLEGDLAQMFGDDSPIERERFVWKAVETAALLTRQWSGGAEELYRCAKGPEKIYFRVNRMTREVVGFSRQRTELPAPLIADKAGILPINRIARDSERRRVFDEIVSLTQRNELKTKSHVLGKNGLHQILESDDAALSHAALDQDGKVTGFLMVQKFVQLENMALVSWHSISKEFGSTAMLRDLLTAVSQAAHDEGYRALVMRIPNDDEDLARAVADCGLFNLQSLVTDEASLWIAPFTRTLLTGFDISPYQLEIGPSRRVFVTHHGVDKESFRDVLGISVIDRALYVRGIDMADASEGDFVVGIEYDHGKKRVGPHDLADLPKRVLESLGHRDIGNNSRYGFYTSAAEFNADEIAFLAKVVSENEAQRKLLGLVNFLKDAIPILGDGALSLPIRAALGLAYIDMARYEPLNFALAEMELNEAVEITKKMLSEERPVSMKWFSLVIGALGKLYMKTDRKQSVLSILSDDGGETIKAPYPATPFLTLALVKLVGKGRGDREADYVRKHLMGPDGKIAPALAHLQYARVLLARHYFHARKNARAALETLSDDGGQSFSRFVPNPRAEDLVLFALILNELRIHPDVVIRLLSEGNAWEIVPLFRNDNFAFVALAEALQLKAYYSNSEIRGAYLNRAQELLSADGLTLLPRFAGLKSAYFTLARINAQLGRHENAVAILDNDVLRPYSVRHAITLAASHEELGRLAEARAVISEAFTRNSTNDALRKRLAHLDGKIGHSGRPASLGFYWKLLQRARGVPVTGQEVIEFGWKVMRVEAAFLLFLSPSIRFVLMHYGLWDAYNWVVFVTHLLVVAVLSFAHAVLLLKLLRAKPSASRIRMSRAKFLFLHSAYFSTIFLPYMLYSFLIFFVRPGFWGVAIFMALSGSLALVWHFLFDRVQMIGNGGELGEGRIIGEVPYNAELYHRKWDDARVVAAFNEAIRAVNKRIERSRKPDPDLSYVLKALAAERARLTSRELDLVFMYPLIKGPKNYAMGYLNKSVFALAFPMLSEPLAPYMSQAVFRLVARAKFGREQFDVVERLEKKLWPDSRFDETLRDVVRGGAGVNSTVRSLDSAHPGEPTLPAFSLLALTGKLTNSLENDNGRVVALGAMYEVSYLDVETKAVSPEKNAMARANRWIVQYRVATKDRVPHVWATPHEFKNLMIGGDLPSGCEPHIKLDGGAVTSVLVHPQHRLAVLAGDDEGNLNILRWDGAMKHIRRKAHTMAINHMHFLENGAWLVTASGDGAIKVWDALKGRLQYTLSAPRRMGGAVSAQAIPHRKSIAALYENGEVIIWSLETRRPERVFHSGMKKVFPRSLLVNPNGREIFVAGEELRPNEKQDGVRSINAISIEPRKSTEELLGILGTPTAGGELPFAHAAAMRELVERNEFIPAELRNAFTNLPSLGAQHAMMLATYLYRVGKWNIERLARETGGLMAIETAAMKSGKRDPPFDYMMGLELHTSIYQGGPQGPIAQQLLDLMMYVPGNLDRQGQRIVQSLFEDGGLETQYLPSFDWRIQALAWEWTEDVFEAESLRFEFPMTGCWLHVNFNGELRDIEHNYALFRWVEINQSSDDRLDQTTPFQKTDDWIRWLVRDPTASRLSTSRTEYTGYLIVQMLLQKAYREYRRELFAELERISLAVQATKETFIPFIAATADLATADYEPVVSPLITAQAQFAREQALRDFQESLRPRKESVGPVITAYGLLGSARVWVHYALTLNQRAIALNGKGVYSMGYLQLFWQPMGLDLMRDELKKFLVERDLTVAFLLPESPDERVIAELARAVDPAVLATATVDGLSLPDSPNLRAFIGRTRVDPVTKGRYPASIIIVPAKLKPADKKYEWLWAPSMAMPAIEALPASAVEAAVPAEKPARHMHSYEFTLGVLKKLGLRWNAMFISIYFVSWWYESIVQFWPSRWYDGHKNLPWESHHTAEERQIRANARAEGIRLILFSTIVFWAIGAIWVTNFIVLGEDGRNRLKELFTTISIFAFPLIAGHSLARLRDALRSLSYIWSVVSAPLQLALFTVALPVVIIGDALHLVYQLLLGHRAALTTGNGNAVFADAPNPDVHRYSEDNGFTIAPVYARDKHAHVMLARALRSSNRPMAALGILCEDEGYGPLKRSLRSNNDAVLERELSIKLALKIHRQGWKSLLFSPLPGMKPEERLAIYVPAIRLELEDELNGVPLSPSDVAKRLIAMDAPYYVEDAHELGGKPAFAYVPSEKVIEDDIIKRFIAKATGNQPLILLIRPSREAQVKQWVKEAAKNRMVATVVVKDNFYSGSESNVLDIDKALYFIRRAKIWGEPVKWGTLFMGRSPGTYFRLRAKKPVDESVFVLPVDDLLRGSWGETIHSLRYLRAVEGAVREVLESA